MNTHLTCNKLVAKDLSLKLLDVLEFLIIFNVLESENKEIPSNVCQDFQALLQRIVNISESSLFKNTEQEA